MKGKRKGIRKGLVFGMALALVALVFAALPMNVSADTPESVDLSTWTAESYPAVSGFPAGVWTVSWDHLSVFQSNNGQPTLFYSDFTAFNTEVQGTIKVETTGDDDFIGFALGFQPGDTTNTNADYLLIDWKQGTQHWNFGSPSDSPGGYAYKGLAVSRVKGVPTADEFWQHYDYNTVASPAGEGLTELARGATLGSTGWADSKEYTFKFEFTMTSLKVYVDDVLEIDITGDFSNGRLAFYNFSQGSVRYSGFTVEPVVIITAVDVKPGSWPNPINTKSKGVLPVAICGLEDFDVETIDPESIRLTREGYEDVGVAPKRYSYEDVATPYTGEDPKGGHDEDGDSFTDLTLKFDTHVLVSTLELTEVAGQTIALKITGNLYEDDGGTPIEGQDYVWILKQGKK